jgi:hypothetical protein
MIGMDGMPDTGSENEADGDYMKLMEMRTLTLKKSRRQKWRLTWQLRISPRPESQSVLGPALHQPSRHLLSSRMQPWCKT